MSPKPLNPLLGARKSGVLTLFTNSLSMWISEPNGDYRTTPARWPVVRRQPNY